MNSNEVAVCACGVCDVCRREVGRRVAAYVLRKRRAQRKPYDRSDPRERKYVHGQVRMLLAMIGLADEELYPTEEMMRSEWGKAMRSRQ